MSMFNYFLVLFGFVGAGLAGCLQGQGVLRLVGAALGLALGVVALTFWKLDQRTAFLLKHAECTLCDIERAVLPKEGWLFATEPGHTHQAQVIAGALTRVWTYGRSFRLVFAIAAIVGVSGAILSVSLYAGWCR